MAYIKKDNSLTIRDVVKRNQENNGIALEVFMEDSRTPFIKNLKEAVEFIKNFIAKQPNAKITIVGDYDADGVCATDILYIALRYMGIEAKTRLPRRFSEGYGLSEKIIDEIDEGLVITVDNGIAAASAIQKAKDTGLSVIVIDHHLAPKDDNGNWVLPPADIVIDPHNNDGSEFEDYCGAGLAYRLAKEMLPQYELKELCVVASIATVADVVPLIGANRTLVQDGLRYINEGRGVPGIRALLKKLNIQHITEEDYGFTFGPIINASGRLYDNGAERVLSLFKTEKTDMMKANIKADNLIKTNDVRKGIVRDNMKLIKDNMPNERPIVFYNEDFKEGIVGILAGRLCEDYHCPSIVLTDSEDPNVLKGSGRSIEEVHLKDSLDKVKDLLYKYGGHAGAAGLSIKRENLNEFIKAFADACGDIPPIPENIYYDLELDVNALPSTCEELKVYAPYGEKNPKILYHMTCEFEPANFKMGDGSHFRVEYGDLTIVGFGMTEKYVKIGSPTRLECVGHLEESYFNGQKSYKLKLVDFM